MGGYKAHWTTGGATDCGGVKSPVTQHDPPLLFDLVADPGEAHALDVTLPEYANVVKSIAEMRAAVLANIDATPRSVVDYSSGDKGKAVNCCNASHVACRCTD
jgi:hypothetical protein